MPKFLNKLIKAAAFATVGFGVGSALGLFGGGGGAGGGGGLLGNLFGGGSTAAGAGAAGMQALQAGGLTTSTLSTGSSLFAGGTGSFWSSPFVQTVAGNMAGALGTALLQDDPADLERARRAEIRANYRLPGYDYEKKRWK